MTRFFDEFTIEYLKSRYRITTTTATRQLKWICRFVRFHNRIHPEQVTQRHVNEFIIHLRDENYSQSSINEAVISLRRMAEFAGVSVEIETRSTRGNYRPPDTLGEKTIKQILEVIPEPERTACGIIYALAQNVSEVVRIRVEDYTDGILTISGRAIELQGLRQRFELQREHARFLGEAFVFYSKKGGHISQALIHSRLRVAAKAVGVWQPVNARVLRASGIRHILEKTGDPTLVFELTSLKPESIKRYLTNRRDSW